MFIFTVSLSLMLQPNRIPPSDLSHRASVLVPLPGLLPGLLLGLLLAVNGFPRASLAFAQSEARGGEKIKQTQAATTDQRVDSPAREDEDIAREDTDADTEADIDDEELQQAVRELGDVSFATRMSANRRLLKAGITALPYLREAIDHPDRELSHRVGRLVTFLEKLELKQTVEAFARSDKPDSFEFPCWEPYVKLMPGDPVAQALFAQMIKDEKELLSKAATQSPEDFSTTFVERTRDHVNSSRFNSEPISVGQLSALLFCCLHRNPELDSGTLAMLVSITDRAADLESVVRGVYGKSVETLIRQSLIEGDRVSDDLIVNLSSASTLPRAISIAQRRDYDARLRKRALIIVDQFGGKSEIPMLESLFDDPTVDGRPARGADGRRRLTTTIGDLALFIAIKFAKLSRKEFGIDSGRMIAFENDEQRNASREKWRELYKAEKSQAQPKKPETQDEIKNAERKKRENSDDAE